MTSDDVTTIGLGLLATLQMAWCLVYASGAWRATPLGWVWLFKGAALAVVWALLFVNEITHLPGAVWAVLASILVAATGTWLWVTIQARFGKYAPYI